MIIQAKAGISGFIWIQKPIHVKLQISLSIVVM